MKVITDIRRSNLKALIEQYGSISSLNEAIGRKRNHPSLSQIRNQSDRGNGTTYEMGDKIARLIEMKLNLPLGWMDTDHSEEVFPEEDNLIYLRKLNVQASCGSGIQNYEDEVYVELLSVSRAWFHENVDRVRENGYEIITASGDSMEPTLKNGDLVIFDRLDTDIKKRDGVFCLLIDNDIFLKRVQMIPGALKFISDNRLYDAFEIKLEEVDHRVTVFGRMVNSLNLKRYD